MDGRPNPIFSALWRTAILLFTVEIAIVSLLRYVAKVEPPPPPILANAYAEPFLVIHVVAGVVALLAGPIQFVRRIRAWKPAFHRSTGRLYVGACAIAAPTGFILALGTTAGPATAIGFAIPALLLAVLTYRALRAAIERRFEAHREWMLRSYAMIATAITLRLMIPASDFLGLEFLPAYQAIAWLSWSTNLVLFEYHIRRTRASAGRYAIPAAA